MLFCPNCFCSSKGSKHKNTNLPTFQSKVCSLVHVHSSRNYYQFIHNAKETGWVKAALLASGSGIEDREEESAHHLIKYLFINYNDAFVHVASEAGLLLTNKEMDAAFAAAMWEESNCPLCAQRIILRHLKTILGRRITAPEHKIRELDLSALLTICNSIEFGESQIHFWF